MVVAGHFDILWLGNMVDRQVVNNTWVHRDTANNNLWDMVLNNAFARALTVDMVNSDEQQRPLQLLLLRHELPLVDAADVVVAAAADVDCDELLLRRQLLQPIHWHCHFVVDNDKVLNRRHLKAAQNQDLQQIKDLAESMLNLVHHLSVRLEFVILLLH